MSSNQKRSMDCIKDTSFNVGTNNVTIDIKVDSDEFSLGGGKKHLKSDVEQSCWKTGTEEVRITRCSTKSYESRRVVIFDCLGISKGF